jgi:hypothetical protein
MLYMALGGDPVFLSGELLNKKKGGFLPRRNREPDGNTVIIQA